MDFVNDPGELATIELLVDLPPVAGSARMKILESQLLGDERMILFHDLEATHKSLARFTDAEAVQTGNGPLEIMALAACHTGGGTIMKNPGGGSNRAAGGR